MEKIIRKIEKGQRIYDIVKEMIDYEQTIELSNIALDFKTGKIDKDDYYAIEDDIENSQIFSNEKLEYLEKLCNSDIKLQKEYLKMISYVDDIDTNNYNKVSILLTFAVMLARTPNKDNVYDRKLDCEYLDISDLYMLSTAMISIPVNEYDSYTPIIYNNDLLCKIFLKTKCEEEQRNICYNIFEYCDDFMDESMSKENYMNAINDCKNIVNNYKLKEQDKDSRVR